MGPHMRALLAFVSLLAAAGTASADQELPIFDAHMHYSHDAWEVVPPKQVVEILKKAGVKRAMVSSSNNEGTKMLQDAAPSVIVPELRPYRSRGELSTWAKDPTIIPLPRGDARQAQVRGDRRVPHLRRRRRPAQHAQGGRARQEIRALPAFAFRRRRRRASFPAGSDRARAVGAFRASSGRRRCARCCAAIPTCGAILLSSPRTPRTARWRRAGARLSWNSPTASWSAPTPSRRSAGTTWSSMRAGRASG